MPSPIEDEESSRPLQEVVQVLSQIRDTLETNLKLQDERISRIESCLTTLVPESQVSLSSNGDYNRAASSYKTINQFSEPVEQIKDSDTFDEVVPYAGISPWTRIVNTFDRTPKRLLWEDENFLSRLRQEVWIPEDGRVTLSFTIDRFCDCSSVPEAENILRDLHNFNQSLTFNGGYFLLRDSDLRGNSRYFTNYQHGQSPSQYSLPPYPYMHWGFEKVVPVSARDFRVPPRRWTAKNGELHGEEPVAPWRRLW